VVEGCLFDVLMCFVNAAILILDLPQEFFIPTMASVSVDTSPFS
jgi:hypothetical protein